MTTHRWRRLARLAAGFALVLHGFALAVAAAGTAAAQQSLNGVAVTLADRFGLTAAERNTIAGGYEAARALTPSAPDGVSAIGGISIDARPSTYLKWAEDFADFDRGSSVQAVRKLSNPPVAADFDSLTLSKEELRDLQRCRVGSCTLQLDGDSIRQVAAIEWRQPDAAARATHVVRAMMLHVALRYSASGDAGLPHYHDARRATDVEENLTALIDEEAASGRLPAPLRDFLRGDPNNVPSQTTSYLYWTTNTFGLKPTTRLNHTVVYRSGADGVGGIIVTKLLYASHYFHGGLEVRYVVANPALDDRFVLVMVTRARSDGLTGLTGALIGNSIRRGALHSLRTYLRFTKDTVEKRQRASSTDRHTRGGD